MFTSLLIITYPGDQYAKENGKRVCQDAWEQIYNFSNHSIRVVKQLLKNQDASATRPFNEKSRCLLTNREVDDLNLTREEKAMMTISRNPVTLICYNWILEFIKIAGHPGPQKHGIAIDSVEHKELYAEFRRYYNKVYESLIDDDDYQVIEEDAFNKILSIHFPFVKFSRSKGVELKCEECAWLSSLRNAYYDNHRKHLVAKLHAYHRLTFMSQRTAYYIRREYALLHRLTHWSLIIDGMQQTNSCLPYRAGKKPFDPQLDHKIEGVLFHHFGVLTTRIYHNLSSTQNIVIDCLAWALETRIRAEQRFPEVLYVQGDGAKDNDGSIVKAFLQYLLDTGMVLKQIVYTRLPAGHNHEGTHMLYIYTYIYI